MKLPAIYYTSSRYLAEITSTQNCVIVPAKLVIPVQQKNLNKS